jgi:hypothetical protein
VTHGEFSKAAKEMLKKHLRHYFGMTAKLSVVRAPAPAWGSVNTSQSLGATNSMPVTMFEISLL